MLKKVLKYDIKNIYRPFMITYVCLLVLSLAATMIKQIEHYSNAILLNLFSNLFLVAYILANVGLFLGCIIFIVVDFYKSFLTDKGFLTFTLPVKTSTLVLSKVINAVIWEFISFLVFVIAQIIFSGPSEFFRIIRVIPEMLEAIEYFGLLGFAIEIGGIILLSIINAPLVLFACMAIGQCFSKQKILASIATYIVISFIIQFVSMAAIFIFSLGASSYEYIVLNSVTGLHAYLIFIFLFQLLLCIIYYFATILSFKKKLNL